MKLIEADSPKIKIVIETTVDELEAAVKALREAQAQDTSIDTPLDGISDVLSAALSRATKR